MSNDFVHDLKIAKVILKKVVLPKPKEGKKKTLLTTDIRKTRSYILNKVFIRKKLIIIINPHR